MIGWNDKSLFLWITCGLNAKSHYGLARVCYERTFVKFTCLFLLQTQVTGSTLNGRKEQLQAEEGDKEKWDFLQFAEAWTPNESCEELKNEILFTHVRAYNKFFCLFFLFFNILKL